MDDLTRFVNARLDEDEANAEYGWSPIVTKGEVTVGIDARTGQPLMAAIRGYTWDANRMRREVAAKRARLALMIETTTEMDRLLADKHAGKVDQAMAIGRARSATVAVKHDAEIWRDHADWQSGWSPER